MYENSNKIDSKENLNFLDIFYKVLIYLKVQYWDFIDVWLIFFIGVPLNKEVIVLKFIIYCFNVLLFVVGYFDN